MSESVPVDPVTFGEIDLSCTDLEKGGHSRDKVASQTISGRPLCRTLLAAVRALSLDASRNATPGGTADPRRDSDGGKSLELEKWLFDKRLEYARFFFDHHAKQRMSMFNFFLVFLGLVLSAYATLFKDAHYVTAGFLGFIASILTLFFIFLERRNEELVHISEDVLESLESDALFCGYDRPILWPRRRGLWRMKESESIKRPLGIFRRQTADKHGRIRTKEGQFIEVEKCERGGSPYEHGIWMPAFQAVVLTVFVILCIAPWIYVAWPLILKAHNH